MELVDPLGSAIRNGVLYTVDVGYVCLFDLETGRPLRSIPVPESTILNGIAVADDGTVYASNTRNPEQIWKVTADGEVSVFAEGAPLAAPNGMAIDQDGNIMVVNVGDNAIITYDQDGTVIRIEHSVEGGNDGIVITADGTKYASSVRHGSVSRIRPGQEAEVIASGIPSAASMCYDSTQNQLTRMVEHAALGTAIHGSSMDAKADDPPRVVVHHHQHPMASQDRRLAPEQVDAPQAILRMPEARQPGGTTRVGGRSIMRGEHSAHHVLVDLDVEGQTNLLGDPRTAPPGVAPLHVDDGVDQCFGRTFRSGAAALR